MKFFGTDGIRGVANIHPLTPEFAMRIALAAAKVLAGERSQKLVVIGSDTRRSGDMFACAAGAALMSAGFDVLNLDVIPTAGLSWVAAKHNAAFGIMISASHNPFWDNGIKIFSGDGFKLSEETEARIEEELFKDGGDRPTHDRIGRMVKANSFIVDPLTEYCEYVESLIEKCPDGTKKKLKIVFDCSNGASSYIAKKIFSGRFNASFINCYPDGSNINFNCGSTHMEGLAAKVKEEHAAAGVAFDGDADRALLVDERGEMVDGDFIMAMLAADMKSRGALRNNLLVTTVMSNLGFVHAMKRENIDLVTTAVGDRNVLAAMIEKGGSIGGEQSGHVILPDENRTGDGLITAVHVLNLMRRSGKKLSDLSKIMKKYPQILINVPVNGDKNAYKSNPAITGAIGAAEKRFEGRGRVLIRPSGTESIVRVMIEGEDRGEIGESAEFIANAIRENL